MCIAITWSATPPEEIANWFYPTVIIEHDFFLADRVNFFFKFLQTYHISNWWLISLWFSVIHFLIWTGRYVVIWEIFISLFCISRNNFSKAYFSILFELPASVHWITTSPAILFDDWSRNECGRYLALCLGLSHLPSPLKQQIFSFFIAFNIPPCSFSHASFATIFTLNAIKRWFWN